MAKLDLGITPTEEFIKINYSSDDIYVYLPYATEDDNFMYEKMYNCDSRSAWLHPQVAEALKNANEYLKHFNKDYRLCIWDAARPFDAQRKMWNKVQNSSWVANPNNENGPSLHTFGLAVDVTIVKLTIVENKVQKSLYLNMGTKFDEFDPKSRIDHEEIYTYYPSIKVNNWKKAMSNRRLLRKVMLKFGFSPILSEWWHFNFLNKTRYEDTSKYTKRLLELNFPIVDSFKENGEINFKYKDDDDYKKYEWSKIKTNID